MSSMMHALHDYCSAGMRKLLRSLCCACGPRERISFHVTCHKTPPLEEYKVQSAMTQGNSVTLLDLTTKWQQQATRIAPPENTGISPARGGLSGPAFFPEGLGLQNPTAHAIWPELMAIGHNFGCEDYRKEIDAESREDNKPTWRNLRSLLCDAGVAIESCYMTNWFVGLQPGSAQVGTFLVRPDPRYEAECRHLLLKQIGGVLPRTILLLGLNVVSRAHEIMPRLEMWAGARNWALVDKSSIGPVAFNVEVPGAGVRANVVALLHPSFSPANQRHRRSAAFLGPIPEAEMIRRALG
jgi:uracil-DNA glycosylase